MADNYRKLSIVVAVTGSSRVKLSRGLVNRILRQPFGDFELILVNSTPTTVLTADNIEQTESVKGCKLRELHTQPGLPVTAIRNIGIKQAKGDWILPLDDDDYLHSLRIVTQLAHARPGRPCMLGRQTLADVSVAVNSVEQAPITPEIYVRSSPDGVPATIMFPRKLNNGTPLYDESLEAGEHATILRSILDVTGETAVVIDNKFDPLSPDVPSSLLSVGMWHGANVLARDMFFCGADPVRPEQVGTGDPLLSQTELLQLRAVFKAFNFQLGSD